MYSIVVPIYQNEPFIPELLQRIEQLNLEMSGALEAVFVVDGSTDRSARLLHEHLPGRPFSSQLLLLSRNFGSFSAVRAGLQHASGQYFAVMAADLQEPPGLVLDIFRELERDRADIVVGRRESRQDPPMHRWPAQAYWWMYRHLIQKEMPPGGVDIFGCNQVVRPQLLGLRESNSSLVGLLFWLGFRRTEIPYVRQPRKYGSSAWTPRRKLKYLLDSVFSFTDLPIRWLLFLGTLGISFALIFSVVVLSVKLFGEVPIPGYAATVLLITFFSGLNLLALGLIGSYVWRTFENTKGRPENVVMSRFTFPGDSG